MNGFAISPPRPRHESRFPQGSEFNGIAVMTDEMLVNYHSSNMPSSPADYAAVRYTDSAGRRWRVDTGGGVTRL